MTDRVFGGLSLGEIGRLVIGQVNRSSYFFVTEAGKVVGYCGWARCSIDDAERWLRGERGDGVERAGGGPACIINMWKASSVAVNETILLGLRQQSPAMTHVYASRFYADGRTRRFKLRAPDPASGHIPTARLGKSRPPFNMSAISAA